MITLPIKDFTIETDDSPEAWYGNITDEKIRNSLFDSDCWDNVNSETHYCILTFDDISADFDKVAALSPEDQVEMMGDCFPEDYTVYDYIRDCMMNSLAVVKSIMRREC